MCYFWPNAEIQQEQLPIYSLLYWCYSEVASIVKKMTEYIYFFFFYYLLFYSFIHTKFDPSYNLL